ncbi:MAG: hypothetical protein M0P31_17025 [Solirubrobacteraceae bacterium]|nr:hypothetical protein [Solirubrobacteraceae bacterium]
MTSTDPLPGAVERDAAIDQAEANAPAEWSAQARRALWTLVRDHPGRLLTTDEVWSQLDWAGAGPPPEPRALGAVMRAAWKAGVIEPTEDYRPSNRPDCHRRPVRVWRSTVPRQAAHDGEQTSLVDMLERAA